MLVVAVSSPSLWSSLVSQRYPDTPRPAVMTGPTTIISAGTHSDHGPEAQDISQGQQGQAADHHDARAAAAQEADGVGWEADLRARGMGGRALCRPRRRRLCTSAPCAAAERRAARRAIAGPPMHAGGAWSRPCPTECAPRHVARRLAKEVEQADAAQQGGGQLDLHHEMCQAGGGLIQAHQLFGGKEALFSPPRLGRLTFEHTLGATARQQHHARATSLSIRGRCACSAARVAAPAAPAALAAAANSVGSCRRRRRRRQWWPRLRLGSRSRRRLRGGDRRVAPAARRLRRRGAGRDDG